MSNDKNKHSSEFRDWYTDEYDSQVFFSKEFSYFWI
jgi:hypothetical protein